METMIVPPINSKGTFTLKVPFSNMLTDNEVYTVTGIRSILEVKDSGVDPLVTIYAPVGLSETKLKEDIANNVPIVVLATEGNNYIYVPANYISTIPLNIGVKYQELMIAASLGSLPVGIDLAIMLTTIHDAIYDTIGVDTTIDVVSSSAIELIPVADDTTFTALRANRKTVTKSSASKVLELTALLNAKNAIITNLECYINNLITGQPC